MDLASNCTVVSKEHVTEMDASTHYNWLQDLGIEKQTANGNDKPLSQSSLASQLLPGTKHTYNFDGSFQGDSGWFSDEVIRKIETHPDVRKT
jgi:hypothetical protein